MKHFGTLILITLVLNCAPAQEERSIVDAKQLDTLDSLNESDSVYLVVDELPRFPGCENGDLSQAKSKESKKSCADRKMLLYFYENLRLEQVNKNDNPEHKIVVSFIIEKDGEISNIELIKGKKTAEKTNILELFEQMPKWIPGKLKGKAVRVKFHLPLGLHYE